METAALNSRCGLATGVMLLAGKGNEVVQLE